MFDAVFWSGIGIGGFIGLVASIVANIFTPKVVVYLDNTKAIFHKRQRRSALNFDRLIRSLHSGRRDKHIYMTDAGLGVHGSLLMGFIALVGALSLMPAVVPVILGIDKLDSPGPLSSLPYVMCVLLFVIAWCFILLTVFLNNHYRSVQHALNNFERYDAYFRTTWGEPECLESLA